MSAQSIARWFAPVLVIAGSAVLMFHYTQSPHSAPSSPAVSHAQSTPAAGARIVSSFAGARVRSIAVHPGEVVHAGQLLVQLELGEFAIPANVMKTYEGMSPAALGVAGRLLQRIPAQTWKELILTDPQRLAAEQEYADALVDDEQHHNAASATRMERAKAARVREQDRYARLKPANIAAAGDLLRASDEIAAWLDRQRKAAEVRAPADGRLEVFDLHPGDRLPVSGRVALLALATP